MREGEKRILLAAALGWIVPAVLLMLWAPKPGQAAAEKPEEKEIEEKETSYMVKLLEEDGSLRETELEAYLLGVLAAEMPASFETEALKAQAVVARTYALRRCEESPKHGSGAVCTEPACCQGYIAPELLSEENREKLQRAVEETAGKVLTYDGRLAEATYFSSSGGSTESAVAVWGSDIPYLQAVSSPDEANLFEKTLFFSREELEEALDTTLWETPEEWVQGIVYSEGDGVESWEIEGVTYRGTEIRKHLGLNSTCFRVSAMGDGITLSSVGFGHRVGMSQYGADAMALKGADYEEILSHYYPGTQVEEIKK